MADFKVWKRENLERLAQELCDENTKLREEIARLLAKYPGEAPAESPSPPSQSQ
jgi:hypothetical protein